MTGAPSFRQFDQYREDPQLIFGLFREVYGSDDSIKRRWSWEFLCCPEQDGTRIFVAEVGGALAGLTVRIPCTLRINGVDRRAWFAADSMTVPKHRGRGLIRSLYQLAARDGGLQLSKGTSSAMYDVLCKMGYREILPNSYQVCLLSPVKWAINRLSGRSQFRLSESALDDQIGAYLRLNRFSGGAGVISAPPSGVTKSADFLNWRYFDIPHRRYHVFVRRTEAATVAMLVLRFAGPTAYLVDLRWDERAGDEPATTLHFAKACAGKVGAVKLVLWGTHRTLRDAAGRQGFVSCKSTPRFSYQVAGAPPAPDWSDLHFVHGDGDIEYL